MEERRAAGWLVEQEPDAVIHPREQDHSQEIEDAADQIREWHRGGAEPPIGANGDVLTRGDVLIDGRGRA